MRCGIDCGALTRVVLVLSAVVFAGSLYAQSPPYGGYANSPYSSGTSLGDQIDDVIIRRGTTTLLSNTGTGAAASPYNTYYGSIPAANLIPGQVHQVDVRPGTAYSQQFTIYIDYNNDGDFADAGETVAYTTTSIPAGTLGTLSFTPPTNAGGILRMRVRAVWSTSGPHGPTTSYYYGEAEDYLVNLGFAIATQSPLPTAAENQSYSTTITATNGQTPYSWNTSISGLPNGITAQQVGDTLVLSGTPTTGSAGTYNFTVSATDSASPSANASAPFTMYVTPPPTPMPFADDFSTTTGWLLGTGWQIGSAVAFTGNTSLGPTRTEPGQDTSPSSDNNILGHMIGADYPNSMPVTYAVSPPINCVGATTVHLRFQRWLGINSGDWAQVQVTNNGTTWTNLYNNQGTIGSNTPTAWVPTAYDATSVAAGNPVVQFRFVIGPTDSSIQNVGWCIDDVEVLDPGPPLEVAEVGGAVISDNEAVGGLRDWGVVNVNTNSSVLTISFTNNGITPITFGSYSKTGSNPNQFYVIKQITTNPLPVGQTDTMEFQFNSPNPGVHTCVINVPHNVSAGAGTSPFEINLRAEAIVPVPDLEVRLGGSTGTLIPHNDPATGTPRDFGTQDIAAGPTAPISITIVNAGTGNMGISTPDMGGTWWNQFIVNVPGSFPSSLAPNASATFEVQFDPSSTGVKDAFVRIAHTDGSKPSPYQVPVLGNAVSSAVPVFSPSDSAGTLAHNDPAAGPRDFGNVQVATISNPITITITNNGGVDLTLGTPTLGGTNPGEFNLDLTGYQTTVTTGNSTTFDVTFEPTSVGQKDATISVTHNDATVTSPFLINVTGNGVTTSPTASVFIGSAAGTQLTNPAPAAGALDFGVQDITAGPTPAVTIYVENTGTAPLTVNTPSLGGANPGEFQLQNTGSFAQTLAIGASAAFDIVFDPTVVGAHTATVQFAHNDGTTGTPFVINVAGQGVLNAPLVEVREGSVTGALVASGDPAQLGGGRDLGSINVTAGATAPITIVIVNQGTLDMNLGTPTLTGPNAGSFVLNTAGYTAVVTPGNNTSFQVTFDPNLGGFKDAQVEFTHDDPTQPSPYIVPVRGTAVDPTGVQIATTALPASTAGELYPATQLQAIQGAAPYTWSVYSGTMPAGLNLSAGGLVDGTPIGFGGVYRVTIRVEDSGGATHEREFTVAISSALTGSGRASSGGCTADGGHNWPALLGVLTLVGIAALVRRRYV